MPGTLEERIAYLEGKVEEHSYAWQDLRERINHLEQKIDQRFIQMDQRFIQMDQRFIQTDQHFTQIEQRLDKLFFVILATLASSIGALVGSLVSLISR